MISDDEPRGGAYRGVRTRMTELVRQHPGRHDDVVPACPDWVVRDLLAHVVGVVADIEVGNLDGVGSDPWTDAQVEARGGRSTLEVVEEWADRAPSLEDGLDAAGTAFDQLLFDTATHELDLRGALDAPAPAPAPSTLVGVAWALGAWAAQASDGPAVAVVVDGERFARGAGEPVATAEVEPVEALRALTGRRSAGQLRALPWDADPGDALVPAFTWGPFTPRATDLVERLHG